MIPEFNAIGFLPPGVHQATWESFANRFVVFDRSDQRLRIGRRIEALFKETQKSGIARRFLVAGSFVTEKPEPNDFDCLIVFDPSIVGTTLLPFQYNILSRRDSRRIYRGDVVPAIDGSEALAEYLSFFQTTRSGETMGIVEIQL